MKRRTVVVGVVAVSLAIVGGAIAASSISPQDPTSWPTITAWHIAPAPGADALLKYQLGTGYGDTADNTIPVNLTTSAGQTITTHSSAWQTIDLSQYGVPASATAVTLQFKAVITGITASETTVYAFVRQSGSGLCPGPPGFENYPVDFTWDGEPQDGLEKCWAVHASIDGTNGVREFNTVTVPVVNGSVDIAWGYRKQPGTWPGGSAVAVDIWLDSWGS